MNITRRPETMTAAERIDEIAGILAVAFRRRQLSQDSGSLAIDHAAPAAAECHPPVNRVLSAAGTEPS